MEKKEGERDEERERVRNIGEREWPSRNQAEARSFIVEFSMDNRGPRTQAMVEQLGLRLAQVERYLLCHSDSPAIHNRESDMQQW